MRLLIISALCFIAFNSSAQELFPLTEPASNMPAHSFGLRLNNELMPKASYRLNPELMWGINKRWMLHFNGYFSNMHQSNFKAEGGSIYTKYRFLSLDGVQSHFRLAAYAKAAVIDNAIRYNDINLSGDNSGYSGGFVATQLLHKLALSATAGYIKGLNNVNDQFAAAQAKEAYNYSLSAGYLLLPFVYKNYNQPNLNLYVELLGKTNLATSESYTDIAPAIQLILKSRFRIDLAYRKQVAGTMLRISKEEYILKFEYNIFSAY